MENVNDNVSVEATEEIVNDVENTNEASKEKFSLRDVSKLMKVAQEQFSDYVDYIIEGVKTKYSINPYILDDILRYTKTDIKNLSEEEMEDFLVKYIPKDLLPDGVSLYESDLFKDKIIPNLSGEVAENHEVEDEADTPIYWYRLLLLELKRLSLELLDANDQKVNLLKTSAEQLEELTGGETPSQVLRTEMKSRIERDDVDDATKEEIRNTLNCDFLFERLNRFSSEREMLKKIFIDASRSEYIIQRFENKIPKCGYDAKVWTKCVALEEKYLPKEYHPFNNFFLFLYMRYVAYIDTDNKRDSFRASNLTQEILDVVYHKHDSTEYPIINVIKRFEDMFMDETDWFNANNLNSPNNPRCIAERKRIEANRRMTLRASFENIGFSDHWDETKTNDELYEMLSKHIEELTASQLDEKRKEDAIKAETTKNENGEDIPVLGPQDPDKMNSSESEEAVSSEESE